MDPVVAVKNLSSLRNIDPCAEAILDKATHTALYRFNNNAKSWEKTDVDGAMFIYRRVDVPFYSLMIANRQSPQDMIEPIVPTIRLKIHQPYLFFCKPDGEIRGLWFCEDAECERIYRVIDGILTTLRNENTKIDAGQGVPVAPPASSVPAPADLPVMSATSVLSTPCINDGTVSALCGTDKPPTPSNERSSILDMLSAAQNRANTNKKVSDGVVGTTPIDNYRPSSEASQGPFVQIMQKLLDTSQTVGSKPLSTPSPLPTAAESVRADELERSFLSNTIPVESVPNTQSAPLLPLRVLRGPTAIHESASGTSLRACSTLSVHGSDDHDPSELGSVRADAEDSVIQPGESATEPPLMDKAQFVSAISHLLATDEGFVRQLHQAYVDALMRRFRLD